jgi:hypothetical protein
MLSMNRNIFMNIHFNVVNTYLFDLRVNRVPDRIFRLKRSRSFGVSLMHFLLQTGARFKPISRVMECSFFARGIKGCRRTITWHLAARIMVVKSLMPEVPVMQMLHQHDKENQEEQKPRNFIKEIKYLIHEIDLTLETKR